MWILASLVGLVLLSELVLRLLEHRLGWWRTWHDHVVEHKWRQLLELKQGAPVDVVVLGDSQAFCGVDPRVLKADGFSCYNAAFYRGVAAVMGPWALDVVLPATRPRLVVWGASVAAFNDNGRLHREITSQFEAAPRRAWSRRRLALAENLALAQIGHTTRSFRSLVGLVTGRAVGVREQARAKQLVADDGRCLEFAEATTSRFSEKKQAYIRDLMIAGWSMNGRQVQHMGDAIKRIRSQGIAVLIMETPNADEVVDLVPGGQSTVTRSQQMLRQLAEDTGAAFLPLKPGLVPESWFADPLHLGGAGASSWSKGLSMVVADLLLSAPAAPGDHR